MYKLSLSSKVRPIFQSAHSFERVLKRFITYGIEIKMTKKMLIQLLHFEQYTQMYRFASQTRDSIVSLEQSYIDLPLEANRLSTLINHNDIFKETLCRLLFHQAETENKTIEEIQDYYRKKVVNQWIDANIRIP